MPAEFGIPVAVLTKMYKLSSCADRCRTLPPEIPRLTGKFGYSVSEQWWAAVLRLDRINDKHALRLDREVVPVIRFG